MTTFARSERRALGETLLAVEPDAPTLCEGWRTRDPAAHLVLRETRPDAAAGIVLPPVAAWTARVQRSLARAPLPELVRRLSTTKTSCAHSLAVGLRASWNRTTRRRRRVPAH
jgi:uncharacterized protein (TIGR03085 family)